MWAQDVEGQVTLLGTRTITCDNAHATLPFGTIDTPGQGETVSGSAYVNFGWALTQTRSTSRPTSRRSRCRSTGRRSASGLRILPVRYRDVLPWVHQQQRGRRLQDPRHHRLEQRAAHDRVDRDRQRRVRRRVGQPLLHGIERNRRDEPRPGAPVRRCQRERLDRRAGGAGAAGCDGHRRPTWLGRERAVAGLPSGCVGHGDRAGPGARSLRAPTESREW